MSHSKIFYAVVLTIVAFIVIISSVYSQMSNSISNTENPISEEIKSYNDKITSKLIEKNDSSTTIFKNKSTLGMDLYNIVLESSQTPPSSAPSWEGNFSITIPNLVLVNDTFDLEYTWTKNIDDLSVEYFELCEHAKGVNLICSTTSNTNNIVIAVTSELEFQDTTQKPVIAGCTKFITDGIDILSENIKDRSGRFSLKFTEMPNPYRPTSIALVSQALAFVTIDTTGNENKTINLRVSGMNEKASRANPCEVYNPTSGSNSPSIENINFNQFESKISTIDLKPNCINDLVWKTITEYERNSILNNSSTCQIVNGEQITNLPPIGYQLLPKYAFDRMDEFIHINYDGDLESFIHEMGFTDLEWIKEFTSYFNKSSKQSHNFFFN